MVFSLLDRKTLYHIHKAIPQGHPFFFSSTMEYSKSNFKILNTFENYIFEYFKLFVLLSVWFVDDTNLYFSNENLSYYYKQCRLLGNYIFFVLSYLFSKYEQWLLASRLYTRNIIHYTWSVIILKLFEFRFRFTWKFKKVYNLQKKTKIPIKKKKQQKSVILYIFLKLWLQKIYQRDYHSW